MTEKLFQRCLIGTAVTLALLLALRLTAAAPSIDVPTEAPSADPSRSPPIAVSTPIGFVDLEARPLFTPDRRPLRSPAPAAPPATVPITAPLVPAAPPLPAPNAVLLLVGIIDAPDGRIALIRVKSSGKVVRVREGAMIDRWRLQRITPVHVMLASGETAQELDFPPMAERRAGSRPLPPRIPGQIPSPIMPTHP
jgi:hypothetical protein